MPYLAMILSMRKTLSILMIALLVSPSFATWLPDDVILSLHKNNLEHYVIGSHSHSDQQHGHEHSPSEHSQQEHGHKNKSDDFNQDTVLNDHHPIHFDITTYFSDTLNVELQRANQSSPDYNALKLSDLDLSGLDFLLVTLKKPQHYYYLLPSKSHIPLHWKVFNSNPFPPYLATARLRI